MSPADALKELNKTLKANAARPAAIRRTPIDTSTCTSPRCTCKQGCGR